MLKEDWNWATKQGTAGFDVEYILYLTKTASDLEGDKPTKKKKGEDVSRIYYKFEDEALEACAEHKVIFNSKIGTQFAGATNPTEYTMKSDLQYQKMIMLVSFAKYLGEVDNFEALLKS